MDVLSEKEIKRLSPSRNWIIDRTSVAVFFRALFQSQRERASVIGHRTQWKFGESRRQKRPTNATMTLVGSTGTLCAT